MLTLLVLMLDATTSSQAVVPPPIKVCMMFRDVAPTYQTFTATLGAKFFLSGMLAVQHANEQDGSVVPQLASALAIGSSLHLGRCD